MKDCNSVQTPMNLSFDEKIDLSKDLGYINEFTKQAYQSDVELVQFLASQTWPNITDAAELLARYNTKLNYQCWLAFKHLLRNLSGTLDLGVLFHRNAPIEPIAYADADWAGNQDPERHSTTGYIIKMAGAPVCWRSVRQTAVSRSTTEAEYISTSEAACELVWLNEMLTDAGLLTKDAAELRTELELKVDNKGAIDLANGESIGRRSKHIEVRHHILRDLVKKGEIKLTHVESAENAADGLTKPLPGAPFKAFRDMIGVVNVA